jgi:hypothetical protein
MTRWRAPHFEFDNLSHQPKSRIDVCSSGTMKNEFMRSIPLNQSYMTIPYLSPKLQLLHISIPLLKPFSSCTTLVGTEVSYQVIPCPWLHCLLATCPITELLIGEIVNGVPVHVPFCPLVCCTPLVCYPSCTTNAWDCSAYALAMQFKARVAFWLEDVWHGIVFWSYWLHVADMSTLLEEVEIWVMRRHSGLRIIKNPKGETQDGTQHKSLARQEPLARLNKIETRSRQDWIRLKRRRERRISLGSSHNSKKGTSLCVKLHVDSRAS